ncbi:hypothetical protein ACHQM5_024034 [Ranunculus cassubicifolius]
MHPLILKLNTSFSIASVRGNKKGVSNCYVFKSRLQEYAQKESFPTPVYETIKEGPSHEPCFRSSVTVNNVTYESLPGFFNRKASEQSAAEIALRQLAKSGISNESITNPVHETGLCKNLLQEYAQKMNYAIPTYTCNKKETPGSKRASFSCTVDIGGIQYIGTSASSKKEAEIRAARTALIAIQSSTLGTEMKSNGQLTVVPIKKKTPESEIKKEKTEKPLKPKKVAFKKKMAERKKLFRKKLDKLTGSTAQDGQQVSVAETNDDSVTPDGDLNLVLESNLLSLKEHENVEEMGEAENVQKVAEQADMVVEAENVQRVAEQADMVVEAHNVPRVAEQADLVVEAQNVHKVAEQADMGVEAKNLQKVAEQADMGVEAEHVQRVEKQADMVVEAENVQRVVKQPDMAVEAENVQKVGVQADVVEAEIVKKEGEQTEVSHDLALAG